MKESNGSRSAQICTLCGASYPAAGKDGGSPGLCRDCLRKPETAELVQARIRDEWSGLAKDAGRSGKTKRHPDAKQFLDELKDRGELFFAIDADDAAVLLEGLETLAAIAETAGALRREISGPLGILRGMFEAAGPFSQMALAGAAKLAQFRAEIYLRGAAYRRAALASEREIVRLRERLVRTEKALATAESYQETLAGSIDDTFRIATATVSEGPPAR